MSLLCKKVTTAACIYSKGLFLKLLWPKSETIIIFFSCMPVYKHSDEM